MGQQFYVKPVLRVFEVPFRTVGIVLLLQMELELCKTELAYKGVNVYLPWTFISSYPCNVTVLSPQSSYIIVVIIIINILN